MAHRTKTFDAVKTMRKIRDDLSRRFSGMTFAEQKRAMERKRKPKPASAGTKKAAKRAT